jgi:predicted nucleotidyltransferase
MAIDELLMEKRKDILRIARSHGARTVRVFGSVARGEAKPGSDVDVLVEMESGRSLLDLIAIKQDLEDLLSRKVDVVTEAAVSPGPASTHTNHQPFPKTCFTPQEKASRCSSTNTPVKPKRTSATFLTNQRTQLSSCSSTKQMIFLGKRTQVRNAYDGYANLK